jgi:DNA-binding response OmpR family regulator
VNAERKPLILLVDDNPQNLQFLGELVEKNGFECALATSGAQTLDFAQREKPDLILLDLMMPEMDGYEVCRKLKARPLTRDIPIIFLTARTESEDIVKGFEVGGVDYVTKPFQAAELLARVKTHVELKRSREEIKVLRGIVPVCASCKSIRDEKGVWQRMEAFISRRTEAQFSHGLCPDCMQKLYPEQAARVLARHSKSGTKQDPSE